MKLMRPQSNDPCQGKLTALSRYQQKEAQGCSVPADFIPGQAPHVLHLLQTPLHVPGQISEKISHVLPPALVLPMLHISTETIPPTIHVATLCLCHEETQQTLQARHTPCTGTTPLTSLKPWASF